MSAKIYADFLEQFLAMENRELLEELGTAIRNWDFQFTDDLRAAYDDLNYGKPKLARHIINGVIGELRAE